MWNLALGRTHTYAVVKQAPRLKTIRLDSYCDSAGEHLSIFLMGLPRSIMVMDIEQLTFDRARAPAGSQNLIDWQETEGESYFYCLSDLRLSGSGIFSLPAAQALLSNQESSTAIPSKLSSLTVNSMMITGGEVNCLISEPRLEHITSLGLGSCQMVDDSNAMMIAKTTKRLRKLDLSRTQVSGVGVRVVVEGLPDLHSLNLNGCVQVSGDAVDWARSKGLSVDYSLGD